MKLVQHIQSGKTTRINNRTAMYLLTKGTHIELPNVPQPTYKSASIIKEEALDKARIKNGYIKVVQKDSTDYWDWWFTHVFFFRHNNKTDKMEQVFPTRKQRRIKPSNNTRSNITRYKKHKGLRKAIQILSRTKYIGQYLIDKGRVALTFSRFDNVIKPVDKTIVVKELKQLQTPIKSKQGKFPIIIKTRNILKSNKVGKV